MFYKSPWTLQAWVLHVVYAFYFNDDPAAASSCWTKHQNLIRVCSQLFNSLKYRSDRKTLASPLLLPDE